jgi:hypothetical protein
MRLPGTRYQEPGWEEVRKLLGQCSLVLLRACDPVRLATADARDGLLDWYADAMAHAVHNLRGTPRAQAAGNSYGDTVFELALTLVCELRARPGDWDGLCTALSGAGGGEGEGAVADALLRKKVNDMYAILRDKVDADNYQAACGRPCSANRIYAYRMLDTARGEIARLFAAWRQHRDQVGAILGRDISADAEPIEVRGLRGAADCRPEWVLRWSATLARFGAGPGPLHTRSKRFEGLKDNAARIGDMLREIGEYDLLSANRDRDWRQDLDAAAVWVEDYWRVLQESCDAATPGPDRILAARADALDTAFGADADADAGADVDIDVEADVDAAPPPADAARLEAVALAVSLPPGYIEAAGAALAGAGPLARALAQDGLAVQLAAYARLLGPDDESYPDAWRDPATGALPTMGQLAGVAGVSLPTLRKRRDAAIDRVHKMRGERTMGGRIA